MANGGSNSLFAGPKLDRAALMLCEHNLVQRGSYSILAGRKLGRAALSVPANILLLPPTYAVSRKSVKILLPIRRLSIYFAARSDAARSTSFGAA